jgi:hypothetical protein
MRPLPQEGNVRHAADACERLPSRVSCPHVLQQLDCAGEPDLQSRQVFMELRRAGRDDETAAQVEPWGCQQEEAVGAHSGARPQEKL